MEWVMDLVSAYNDLRSPIRLVPATISQAHASDSRISSADCPPLLLSDKARAEKHTSIRQTIGHGDSDHSIAVTR